MIFFKTWNKDLIKALEIKKIYLDVVRIDFLNEKKYRNVI